MLRFHGSRDKVSVRARRPQLAPRRAAGGAAARSSCRTSTPGATAAAPAPRTTRTAGLGELAGAARAGRRLRSRLAPVRDPARARRRARGAALAERRDRQQALLRARRCTASRRCAPWSDVELPGTDEAARTHLAIPMSPVLSREQADEVVAAVRDADLGRPHELAARARHAAGDPGARAARRRGRRHRARLRADARAARALRDRPHGDRPPPRRPARGEGRSGWRRARARSCAGPRASASTSRSATAPTTSRSPPSCSASRARRRSTTSGRPSSTPSTAGSRGASSCPTRSRPSGSRRYGATPAKLRRYAGLKEEYYLADFEPDRGRARRARARPRPRRSPSCARRPRSRSTTASSTRCSRRCCERLREQAQVVVLPRTPEQRAELARAGGFVVPEHAIDAQSLIAFADLVISAGGTMNREAVALGTPVWTTFEGRLGAVDERADRRGPAAAARARRGRHASSARRQIAAGDRVRRDPEVLHGPVRERPLHAVRAAARADRLPGCAAGSAPRRLPDPPPRLPQVALDAGLVALAYYLAYRLRFDGGGPAALRGPVRAHDRVRRSSAASSSSRWSACTGTGCATRRSASTCRSPRRVVVAVLALLGYVAVVQPQLTFDGERFVVGQHPGRRARALRAADARASSAARASSCTSLYERPLRGFRARRDARSVLIVGAGDGGRLLLREILRNPELGYRPVGFVDDDPRKQGARIDRGARGARHDRRAAATCSRTSSPTRC